MVVKQYIIRTIVIASEVEFNSPEQTKHILPKAYPEHIADKVSLLQDDIKILSPEGYKNLQDLAELEQILSK